MSSKQRQKGTAVSNDKTPVPSDETTVQSLLNAGSGEGQDTASQGSDDSAGEATSTETSGESAAEELAPVAAAEPVAAAAPAAAAELNAFQALTADQRANGMQSARVVVDTMDGYMLAMRPGLPVTDDEVIVQQTTLWRLIQRVLNDENYESLEAGLGLLIKYFAEYRKTALAEVYVFRGAELLTLPPEQTQAFHAALNVLHIAAATGVKSVPKHADLNRSFPEQVYTDTARNNIMSFFS